MRGKPKAQLVLRESEREQLVALTMRRKTAQALADAELTASLLDGASRVIVQLNHGWS